MYKQKGHLKRKLIYLAAPLFSQAERQFNILLADLLEQYFDVFLPQRDGGMFVNMVEHGVTVEDAARAVFNADIQAIENCDFVVAVLDGRSIDEGVAFEVGFAYAKNKPCYGIQTDFRRLLPIGNNPMLSESIIHIFHTSKELLEYINNEVKV